MPLKKKSEVVSRHIAGETLLVPLCGKLADMRTVYMLEGSAGFIWDRIDGSRDSDAIARDVSAEFDVEEAVAMKDVEALVSELVSAGLIEKNEK